MGDRGPQIMLTDQSNDIKTAVAAVFPRTQHCFGLWYILEKVQRQLEYYDTFSMKFHECVFKSWTEEQFEKRWPELIDEFQLNEVEWIRSLYADRNFWVPTFLKGVSFASLSGYLSNSPFDRYVQRETSVKEFVERYKTIVEDMYEEEAKADFDAWHEVPELKSPSPFEKQMHLLYTREIFEKFQVEVLGAAACHFKTETEDETIATYDVKDFEDNQSYVVERNGSGSEIYCSCRSFELNGYLCRHAIVVLQMSGIFSIPPKYVLQRWTNAARSRHSVGERQDEAQAKIRRFNDLCRRAIILGEEGSLSQESYDLALAALKEGLKQCGTANNSAVPNPVAPQMSETGKGKETVVFDDLQKGKSGETTSAGTTQEAFDIVDMSDLRPLQTQNMVPTFFHNIAPAPFHNTVNSYRS
ncbi:Protein FAR1-RELATED SEQUENCE 4 [Linum grandiflorum]